MDSVVLYTEEIDDLQEAAKELFDQAKAFPLKKNSVALLYAEEETDLKALYALLSKQWDFPVLGCTAMAMLMSNKGYRSIGISVMLMTGDDVSFAAGISDALRRENCESEIARTYAAVKAQLPSEEKLIITFGGMPMEEDHVAGDEAVRAIEKACERYVPIFGGLASEGSVRLCSEISELDQPVLHLPDQAALVPVAQVSVLAVNRSGGGLGRGSGRGRRGVLGVRQSLQGPGAGDAVHRQAVLVLEPLDGVLRIHAEIAVHIALIEAQRTQLALQIPDRVPVDALLEHGGGGGVGGG